MTSRRHVLVIDDEADTLLPVLATRLEPLGYRLTKLDDPDLTLEVLAQDLPDLVLLDLHFPGDELSPDASTTGGRLLGKIRQAHPDLPVMVFTTSLDDSDMPLEGLRHQPDAWYAKPDFVATPGWAKLLDREITETIEAATFVRMAPRRTLGFVVGRSAEMAEVVRMTRLAGRNKLNTLVCGDAGTGKGLVAEAIHHLGDRSGAFIRVDCASLDPDAAPSIFFGAQPSAVHGDTEQRLGLLDEADGGTLFLDQIQYLPKIVQQRFCAVMDEGRVSRVGALDGGRPVDVRFIGSTQHTLADLVGDDYLVEGFAQRFAVMLIQLPPLRRRMVDLQELFEALLESANLATGRSVMSVLRPETQAKLEGYDWPGNVRELETTLMRAVVNTTSNVLIPDDIVFSSLHGKPSAVPTQAPVPSERPMTGDEPAVSDEAVHHYVEDVLAQEIGRRYNALKQIHGDFRKAVLMAIIARLRLRLGRKVSHKHLLAQLDPNPGADGSGSDARLRKFMSESGVRLTDLDFNR